jgi:parallel beta-helix repeat protein
MHGCFSMAKKFGRYRKFRAFWLRHCAARVGFASRPDLRLPDAPANQNVMISSPRSLFTPTQDDCIESLESRIAPAVFLVTNIQDVTDAGHDTGSLRDALALADAHAGHDVIKFHVFPEQTVSESVITLDSALDELISKGDVTIKGPGAGKLIIDGGGNIRVLSIYDGVVGKDSPATISALSIVNGKAPAGATGGGIFSEESLTLKNVIISGNTATKGAGLNVGGDGSIQEKVTIIHSRISGNTATDVGGGFNLYGLLSLKISKTAVTGNTATSHGGGGGYAQLNSTGTGVKISGCVISGNTADHGGGLFVNSYASDPNVKITIANTIISGNAATNTGTAGGGGLYVEHGNTMLIGSTITNNTTQHRGGGLEANLFDSLTISHCTITGNATLNSSGVTPNNGGGLFILGESAAFNQPVKISNSQISGNRAINYGGGLYAYGNIPLTISSTVFNGNRATSGGGVRTYGDFEHEVRVTISGSTFTDNTATDSGGGMELLGTGDITISDSTFSRNHATDGGGLSIGSKGSLNLQNIHAFDNSASNAGGALQVQENMHFLMTGGLFTGNNASQGGAIEMELQATGTIKGVVITGNSATIQGGGVRNEGATADTLLIQSEKVFANTAPNDPDVSGGQTSI